MLPGKLVRSVTGACDAGFLQILDNTVLAGATWSCRCTCCMASLSGCLALFVQAIGHLSSPSLMRLSKGHGRPSGPLALYFNAVCAVQDCPRHRCTTCELLARRILYYILSAATVAGCGHYLIVLGLREAHGGYNTNHPERICACMHVCYQYMLPDMQQTR